MALSYNKKINKVTKERENVHHEEEQMKTLNRTQLKFIAICAMVCDHVAWGFVDFYTPLGQILHIIGRLTVPTMCFFVAEGFRHTASRKGYVKRMSFFWIVAALPFYLFFHEVYDYRQNIIFDLLLGLLMLCVLENKKLKLWQKVILGGLIFTVSATVGGWVIMPILYILVFYYVRDFKKQAIWVCGLTVALQIFLIVAMSLNRIWHFSHYDWPWYDKLYLLGFMIPLLLLRRYNGEKGKDIIGKYFFYLFYPAHFLVLAAVKAVLVGCTVYEIYVACHLVTLFVASGILLLVLSAKPSKGQNATLILVVAGMIYLFGFCVEIISRDAGGYYIATVVQYFGECLLMIGFTYFVGEMCHREVPSFVYAFEGLCSILIMWMLLTTRENRIFYTSIEVDTSGPFPRLSLEYGFGFLLMLVYMVLVCISCFVVCVLGIRRSAGIERKRILCVAAAILCPWIPNFIRGTGITGGYEVPFLGVAGAVILVGMALTKYGYFDSIVLAGENALNHGTEGIMVIDTNHMITYYNKRMETMFGQLALKKDAYKNNTLADIFEGNIKTLEIEERMYEMRVEALKEGGYVQGYMLWVLDITEHHEMLMKVNTLANRDSLTGIYNRSCFKNMLEAYLKESGEGAFFMIDLDNFKQINDRFGHQAGDEVLVKFGQVLQELGNETIPGRIGGDEFCLFCKGINNKKDLENIAVKIAQEFQAKLSEERYKGITTVSLGIARTMDAAGKDFERLYSNADKALYVAKNRSKNTYYIL